MSDEDEAPVETPEPPPDEEPEPDDVPDPQVPVEPKLGLAEFLGVKAMDTPTRAALLSWIKHTHKDVYGVYTREEWEDYYQEMMTYSG